MRIDVQYNQTPQRPLSFWEQWQIAEILSQYPALTLKVIALIHWHALWLAFRRVPWHRKGARPDLQREVLNPAASLAPGPAARAAADRSHAH